MSQVLIWWLLIELIGLAVWPLVFRFFRRLPDRGYAFTKPVGLLLIAYPFWLFTTLGFLENSQGAIALVAVGIASLSWFGFGSSRQFVLVRQPENEVALAMADGPAMPSGQVRSDFQFISARETLSNGNSGTRSDPNNTLDETPIEWLREHARTVIATELVFTLAFFGWAWVRAYMPEITATEKPMDFAFLNGILQSRHFPPLDPWLSGYAISYYYFGYLIIAILTLLSGVPSSIAYNLALALLFALAATGAFGLVYNLIVVWELEKLKEKARGFDARAVFFAIFGPVFLVLMGNLEGVFEALHARGLGSPEFWNWLDIKGLADAPVTGTFAPTDNWWWWRASRVIHDVAQGQTQEVIDEFPQFSFLLGDMHPHVLALPFVFPVLAAALNVLRGEPLLVWSVNVQGRQLRLLNPLLALMIGALGFINTWDMPTYAFVVVAAFALARYLERGQWNGALTSELLTVIIEIGIFSLLLYLPFYIGFQSQAGGVLPVLFVKTQLHQYLIMFGFFVFTIGLFVAHLLFVRRKLSLGQLISDSGPFLAAVLLFPFLIAAFAIGVLAVSPAMRESARAAFPNAPDNWVLNVLGAYFGPLRTDPWLFVLLAVLLVTLLMLVKNQLLAPGNIDRSVLYVVLIAFTGFLLTFGIEFVYLRDSFGTRMNSVFKFYYQAWAFFSVAAGFAVYYLSRQLKGWVRGAWSVGLVVLLGAGLIYPAEAIANRADDFGKPPTLDGIQWIKDTNPGDYAVIQWLGANAPRGSTILEATGGEYSYGNRISMATGLPTVLGWAGHELQWRGNSRLFKDDALGIDRAADIARIYQTTNSAEALTLLDKYAINFVVVGGTERSQYALNKSEIDKFGQILKLVFESGDARIYARVS